MRIVFVRHGEPDYARDCLTETGRAQAEAAALRLKGEGVEELWSSPLGRALETARAASEALGLPVRVLDFMREVTWGSMDGAELYAGGHPWAIVSEMARQGLRLNDPGWRESPFFRTNRVVECVDRIEAGIDDWLAGFGYVREGAFYRQTGEEKEHRTVALFSHGGSSCAAMGHILDLPFPYAIALLHIDFTGITAVELEGRAGDGALARILRSNDTGHLREG
ncbi:MAG: histidine phosphatase family protein [Oscillospiraceae bacterium]|nr:histidine phosphatase family protein [Oscillospiraceae bacterium]